MSVRKVKEGSRKIIRFLMLAMTAACEIISAIIADFDPVSAMARSIEAAVMIFAGALFAIR
jgi:hypothetical protein